MDDDALALELAAARHASVEAPAGHGKTELLSKAVGHAGPDQLILTHTNAGVGALRSRTRRLGSHQNCQIFTLDSWCQAFVTAYPKRAGVTLTWPDGTTNWPALREGMLNLLAFAFIRDVISRSYSGAFIDEYQDCDAPQRQLVEAIARVIPTRILGDRLQQLFPFDPPRPDWDESTRTFPRLPTPSTPHRWAKSNPALGSWLIEAREALLAGAPIDLANAPVRTVTPAGGDALRTALEEASAVATSFPADSVLVVCRSNKIVLAGSGMTGGRLQPVERIEPPDISESIASNRVLSVALAKTLFSLLATHAGRALDCLAEGSSPASDADATARAAAARLRAEPSAQGVLDLLRALIATRRAHVFRREMAGQIAAALELLVSSRSIDLLAAFRRMEAARSQRGRRPNRLNIGTHYVVKGLEFDHVVIADVGKSRELIYVALTRGRKTVTVIGEASISPLS